MSSIEQQEPHQASKLKTKSSDSFKLNLQKLDAEMEAEMVQSCLESEMSLESSLNNLKVPRLIHEAASLSDQESSCAESNAKEIVGTEVDTQDASSEDIQIVIKPVDNLEKLPAVDGEECLDVKMQLESGYTLINLHQVAEDLEGKSVDEEIFKASVIVKDEMETVKTGDVGSEVKKEEVGAMEDVKCLNERTQDDDESLVEYSDMPEEEYLEIEDPQEEYSDTEFKATNSTIPTEEKKAFVDVILDSILTPGTFQLIQVSVPPFRYS